MKALEADLLMKGIYQMTLYNQLERLIIYFIGWKYCIKVTLN